MGWNEILTLIAVFTSPVIAVAITIWYQNRKERQNAKMSIFMRLVLNRPDLAVNVEYVSAFNAINIVFHKDKSVIKEWEKVFESLHKRPFDKQAHDVKLLDLLDSMGKSLGYSGLRQTAYSVATLYTPQGHQEDFFYSVEFRENLLRVLRNSENFCTPRKMDIQVGNAQANL